MEKQKMAIEKNGSTPTPKNNPSQPESGYLSNGLDDLGSLGIETQSGGVDTEGFAAFAEEMTRRAKSPEIAGAIKIEVIPVSSQQLELPVLAMCSESKDGVIVYSLLIEGMMNRYPLPPIKETRKDPNTGMMSMELIIDLPTARCYDSKLREVVASVVAAQMGVRTDRIIHMSHCVVPRAARLQSPEIARLYFDSANLALTTAIASDKIKGITADNLSRSEWNVQQYTKFTPGTNKLSKVGTPIASDFTTSLILQKRNNQNQSLANRAYEVHQQQQQYDLCEATGFIDYTVVDVPPVPQANPAAMPTRPGFMPMVVLTEVTGLANKGRSIEDIKTQILGVASTVAVLSDHAYVRVHECAPGSKSEKASVGLMGLEHDPYVGRAPKLAPIKVESISINKKPSEGALTPLQVAEIWHTENVMVALDVEEGSRLSWVQDLFIAATGRNGDSALKQAANATIIKECDDLTRGLFSQAWSNLNNGVVAPVVMGETCQIHLGTYRGPNGEPRDIRSIDYLSILANSPKDLEVVSKVTACMIPQHCNPQTLTDRRNYLEASLSDFTVTGMATRVFFNKGFIRTLVGSLIQAGVTFRSDDVNGYGKSAQRVVMNYNMGDTISGDGLYSNGYQPASAPGMQYGGYYNPMMVRPR
jgi:hypothetical protein